MLKTITSSTPSLPLLFKFTKSSSSLPSSSSPASPPPSSSSSSFSRCLSLPFSRSASSPSSPSPSSSSLSRSLSLFHFKNPMSGILGKLGFGPRAAPESTMESSIAQGPDEDLLAPGQQFAQFAAGCFWGVELAFQRVPGVTKTEVGYSQGFVHNPTYEDVCTGTTGHAEVGNDVGTQYRSGIYYYTPEQEKAAIESTDRRQKLLDRKIVTEILPAKKFYRAEEYHQQYLAKGGRFGRKQSAEKGCTDPIRCYG
ncbi:hypothetical protein Cgig2_019872 [Carnegiea gigantea]|uniref:peptide-methionine (S)-S-oxide reductase n=1 Tax=Carnegiea gigantea TaxID=171969 RepID=A0A9Q1QJN7_9CARY|nr:hypothetical protein Cgig2_019872 [Carnegiea gigantea]